jgi:trans-aconitate methyltransferase
MNIAEAAALIRLEKIYEARVQRWCDLGCGTGTFTLALATLLAPGSVIDAIDKDERALAKIPDEYQQVRIHKQVLKLNDDDFFLPLLDGVLMANFLHYMKHPHLLLRRLRPLAKQLLIVEYENRQPNRWVPYPLSFSALRELLVEEGFSGVVKVGTRRSRFGGQMYSVFAE